ncbi:hypothetical protein LOC68_27980 [Blastopirellula sp. JC732]|uniref:Uncharacterized protein n=1 Tax=Blastopirellula sediminis TaxID=2894196 RepID=A0A9X1MT23_9BACT|nr:hypothetical protein [Blastopirellula sediminis]MCC9604450.1 hypothetical protein [Blastopirellula sediminis]MCC9632251.1 hypothetical protein [Blastopirellula sediminis]
MIKVRNSSLMASAVTVFLSLAACVSAQDAGDAAAPAKPEAALAERQARLAQGFSRLEDLMIKMAEIDEIENPERAKLLREAAHASKDKLIRSQLETLVAILGDGKLKRAVDGQKDVSKDLNNLLQLLQSENRDDELKSEQERIREYIKETKKLLNRQRSLQGRTEGGENSERLSDGQDQLSQDAAKLAQRMKENEEPEAEGESSEGEGEEGEQQPGEKKPSEEGESKPSEGEMKPSDGEGEQKPSDGSESKPGESGESKPGENKPGEEEMKKPGDEESGEKKPGEESKPGEQKPGEQKPGEQKPGEPMPSEGEPQEGEPKEGKPQQGQPQQGQPQQGQPQQGDQQQGQDQQQQQQQPDFPARKRVEEAQRRMEEAKKKLDEKKTPEAIEEQKQAETELAKAIAELEEVLRQLREEEIERVLARLEARFSKMLEMQLKVYDDSERLSQVPEAQRGAAEDIQAGKLAFSEKQIVLEADKAMTLLQEEGSSIAFPEALQQLRDDMENIADRLSQSKVDPLTLTLEQDVIDTLEELLAALKQAQKEQEERKQQQQQQQQQQGQPQDEALVNKIQELKLIKSMQVRINQRTERYAKLLRDVDDEVGQATSEEVLDALRELAQRQQRVYQITQDNVLGKNQ